jgi:hypothetical protein
VFYDLAIAQTFTVGTSGILSRIDLGFWRAPGSSGDLVLDILPASAMATYDLGASLVRSTIPIDRVPVCNFEKEECSDAIVTVELAPGVRVNSGQRLAIVITRAGLNSPQVLWQLGSFYDLGDLYFSTPAGAPWMLHIFAPEAKFQMRFRTWISP